jgi:hypothetical protein
MEPCSSGFFVTVIAATKQKSYNNTNQIRNKTLIDVAVTFNQPW